MEFSSDKGISRRDSVRESVDEVPLQVPESDFQPSAVIREYALIRQDNSGMDDDSVYYYSDSGSSVSDSSSNEPPSHLTTDANAASEADGRSATPNNSDVGTLVIYNPNVGFFRRDTPENKNNEGDTNDNEPLQARGLNYQLIVVDEDNDNLLLQYGSGSDEDSGNYSLGGGRSASETRGEGPLSRLTNNNDNEASAIDGRDSISNDDDESTENDEMSFFGMQVILPSREGSIVDEESSLNSTDGENFSPDPEGEYRSSDTSVPAETWGQFDEVRATDQSDFSVGSFEEDPGRIRVGFLSETNGRSFGTLGSNSLNRAEIRENDESNVELFADFIIGGIDMDSRSSDDQLEELFQLEMDDDESSSSSDDDESGENDSDASTDYSVLSSSILGIWEDDELETEFEDEEDRVAFEGMKKRHYRKRFLPIKQMSKVTFNYSFGHELSHLGKDRIGHFLSLAKHLKQTLVYIQEDDELSCLFSRDFEPHELRRFFLSSEQTYHIHPSEVLGLKRYLSKAPFLKRLLINDISLGLDDLNILISDFSGEELNLQNTGNGDALGPIVLTELDTANLKSLTLSGHSLGIETCRVLADFLSSDKTPVESLELSLCQIDDECVQLLIEALKSNTKLSSLDLSQNVAITDETWCSFEKLLYDSSSFDAVFGSNHTLQNIVGFPMLDDSEGWGSKLDFLLDMNRNWMFNFDDSSPQCLWLKCRTKIFHYIMEQESQLLKIDLFFDIKALEMPKVIEFIGRNRYPSSYNVKNLFSEGDDIDSCNLNVMYQLIRQWQMPSLFSFPSREKVLLTSKIYQLQNEKQELLGKINKLRKFAALLVLLVGSFLVICILFISRQ